MVGGVTVVSSEPGQINVTWDEANPTPTDYWVTWKKSTAKWPSYMDDNTVEGGNAFPTETSYTVSDLEEGTAYGVRVRARYYDANDNLTESGPWSDPPVEVTVSSQLPSAENRSDKEQVPPRKSKKSPPLHDNLSYSLNELIRQNQSQSTSPGDRLPRDGGAVEESATVVVYVEVAHSQDVVLFLRNNGATVRSPDPGDDYLIAEVPLSLLPRLSQRPGVEFVKVDELVRQSGGPGATAHGAAPWDTAGYDGTGVKVGVIDSGFKGYSALIGTHLPQPEAVRCWTSELDVQHDNLADCEAASESNHGTAVTEMLFDVAPGATYYLARILNSSHTKEAVDWLIEKDVDVINFSLAVPWDGPGDGTSPYSNSILKTVDTAVDSGALFSATAGNQGDSSWYGELEDSDGDNVLEFTTGDECNLVTLEANENYLFDLRWKDDWHTASTDLDTRLTGPGGVGAEVASGERSQDGTTFSDPFERISYTPTVSGDYCFVVEIQSGHTIPTWAQFMVDSNVGVTVERTTEGHSIDNPGETKNAGALTVGAAAHDATTTIAASSGRGPLPDGTIKPDIVGAHGVYSRTYGRNAYGTSFSAPHVAGLAAVIKERFPDYTPSEIATYLKDNALARGTPTPNNTWGHGFAHLPAKPPSQPVVTGRAEVGEALEVNISAITDGDGVTTATANSGFSVQWLIVNTDNVHKDIDNATSSTYTITSGDRMHRIKARVSFTDDGGNDEVTTSEATNVVNSDPTGILDIDGTARIGRTLTAQVVKVEDPDGVVEPFTYQWVRVKPDDTETDIATATSSTYKLIDADAGHRIKFKLSFTDGIDNTETLESELTTTVGPNLLVGNRGQTTVTTSYVSILPATASTPTKVAQSFTTGSEDNYLITSLNAFVSTGTPTAEIWDDKSGAPGEKVDDLTNPGSIPSGTIPDELIEFSAADVSLVGGTTYWVLFTLDSGEIRVRTTTLTDEDDGSEEKWAIGNDFSAFIHEGTAWETGMSDQMESGPVMIQVIGVALNSNDEPVGDLLLSGAAQVGEALTVDASNVSDPNGLVDATFEYQWVSIDGATETDIGNATGASYTLTGDDGGKRIKVEVTYTDDAGYEENLVSLPTQPVRPQDGIGIMVTNLYQESSETTFADANFPHLMQAFDTGDNADGYTLNGVRVGAIAWDDGVNPVVSITEDDVFQGKSAPGPVLYTMATTTAISTDKDNPSVDVDFAAGDVYLAPNTRYWVQFFFPGGGNGKLYVGVTTEDDDDFGAAPGWTIADFHVFTAAGGMSSPLEYDHGNQLRIAVLGKAGAGNRPPEGQPAISGGAQVNEVLTADTSGITDGDGLTMATYTYQWVRVDGASDTDISGSTSQTYTLTEDDQGKRIRVEVSFSDDRGHSATISSRATQPVRPESGHGIQVSNAGQDTADLVGVTDQFPLGALSFTTGGHSGVYRLNSVRVAGIVNDDGATPKVSLYSDASGLPGTDLHALTVPSGIPTGATANPAPAELTTDIAVLAPNTTYWVVFERTASSANFYLRFTDSTDDDFGAASGWSLGDVLAFQRKGISNWLKGGLRGSRFLFQIAVKAAPGVDICSRTAEVQTAILASVGGGRTCSTITDTDLASIGSLRITGYSAESIVPADFAGLTSLSALTITASPDLNTVPENAFSQVSGVAAIQLSGTSISSIHENAFDGLTGLSTLFLSSNSLTTLPGDVFDGLTGLSDLYLNSNSLTTLPGDVFDGLTGLSTLYLNSNSLTTLPGDVFDGLTGLNTLQLSSNSLTTLPGDIFDGLTGLNTLQLSSNSLTTLPGDVFDGLTEVKTLHLSSNSLTTLPGDVFDGLTELSTLYLNSNSLTTLPADVFDGLTVLRRLDLSANSLAALPADVFDGLTVLRRLDLSANSFTALPADVFDGLTGLSTLDLSSNSLTTLPANIFDGLTGLGLLDLECNSLTELNLDRFDPFSGTLTSLDIRGNRFTTPPSETAIRARLTSLTTLLTGTSMSCEQETGLGAVPGAPASLNVAPGDTQVTLTWTAPASDGGQAVAKYQYRVSADGRSNWNPDWTDVPDGSDAGSDLADERSLTLTSLDNGTTYTFQLRAVNSVGEGSEVDATATPQAPVAAPGVTRSVAENTAAGVDIGAPVAATGASGTVTYTLGGTDAASFDIVTSTGQLQTKAALDYETKSSYEVTITAADSNGATVTTVTIEVTNVIELTAIAGPETVSFAENGAGRVATYTASSEEDRDSVVWTVAGTDGAHFTSDAPGGALRFHIDAVAPNIFPKLPDFESSDDADTNNDYEITLLARAGSTVSAPYAVTVTVTDVDEAGAVSLSSTRPALGAALTTVLSDPDGVTDGTAVWQWERSTGRNSWAVIDGAAAANYTPVAADTNTFLRVTATYADEHGTGKTVSEVAPNVVTGPLLMGLTAETDRSQANPVRGLYPAFDPQTLHYGIGCKNTDTLVLSVSAAANARVAVAGVQAGSAPEVVSVAVTADTDVAIRVTDASGAGTTYVVHCLRDVFFEIETHTFPNTDAFEDLILFNRDGYFRLMDRNGVPRVRLRFAGASTFASRFHRVGADGAYRYGFRVGRAGYTILDEDFEVVADDVETVSPLTRLDRHDFQILEDGNYLLMAYEPATRDFSDIDLPYPEGANLSAVAVEDSAFQIVTPGEQAVFTWNSWDNMAIEDCVPHRFPLTLFTDPDMRSPNGDYAHMNGMHVVDGVLVASMRGCSKVLGIEVEPGATQGDVLWRMGRTNLSEAEWAARDIGPRPLDFINDPEGEFCSQHTARFLPNGNVFLFDNGVLCAIDPWTFDELGREGNDFSRAVEYALDLENHEAVFVRDHSLRGERSHLGYANGNVDVLDNGDWLVGWGRPPDGNVTIPDNERATLVDPATGQEKLGIRLRELPSDVRDRRINATVAPAEALAPQPVPLAAEFPASSHTSIFHTGTTDSPQVVVALSRPVVDFDETSPSLSTTGATITSVAAHVVVGEPANSYLVTLTPDGDGAITFQLLTGLACAEGGICTADGTTLSTAPAPLVIAPPVTVTFGAATYTAAEGGSVSVTVELSADPRRSVTIPVTMSNEGTTTDPDYSGVPDSVTFDAGDTEETITFSATQDMVDDDGESVLLGFGTLPGGVTAGSTITSTVRITDDDDPEVTVSFGASAYTAAEGGGVSVTVALSADPEREVTIPLTATNQGGASNGDYFGVPANVTFSASERSKTFTFSATQDTVDDDDESVVLGFGTLPTGVSAGTPSTSTVRITDDDDPSVTVSFGAATYDAAEGGSVSVEVTLSADPERSVTVPVTRGEQGGATNADYSGVPDNVTFTSGDTSETFTFRATQDTVDDDDESVLLGFGTMPTLVTAVSPSSSTVRITDDDHPAVTVSFGQSAYTAAEGGSVTVEVTLNAAPERSVTIPITRSNQDGASNGDYSGVPASVAFGATETSKTFTFSAVQDTVDDDDESVELGFGTLPTGVSAGTPRTSTVRITDDDDPAVTVSFSRAAYTAAEGGSVTVEVTLSAAPERSVTIPLTATNQNGATSADYSGVPADVRFTSGEESRTFTFTATQDMVDDDGERVLLGFGTTLPALVTAGSTATSTVSITDNDDPAVTVSFGAAAYTAVEGGGVTVTVELSADPERSVTIPITATGQGGATDGDYSVPASVTFTSGDTSETFRFSATDDSDDDDDESVELGFGALPAGASPGSQNTSTVRITDNDDPAVTVSFSQATYPVGEGSGVTVTVRLSADPERSITIPLTATGQDGATDVDYSGVPANVTFNATQTSRTFIFNAAADSIDDDGERVLLGFGRLPTGVSTGTRRTATVSIRDNDDPSVTVSFGQGAYSVAEGDDVTVTVELSADPERTVTIPLTATNQNGATSADYSGVPANVTFTIGDTSETFTFRATQDTVDDDDESVLLGFGTMPTLVTAVSPSSSTVRITDDDHPAVTVSFGAASYTAAEGGSVSVEVTLSADPERSVTIPITRTEQDGASSGDYSGVPASVTFTSGDTSETFAFRAIQDSDDDDDESVSLGFGTRPAHVSAGTPRTSTVRITDDDDPAVTVSFGQAAYAVAEGGSVIVTVELSADPERSVTVPLTRSEQDGASNADYSGVPRSVAFSASETGKTFTFAAFDDSFDDDGESVLLRFGGLPAGVSAGTPSTSTVNITDDDGSGVTIRPASLEIDEGATGTYTVVLDSAPAANVTLTPSISSGNGFTFTPPTLTFTMDNWDLGRTVTVTGTSDADALDHTGVIAHTVASTDSNYRGTAARVSVTVMDTDDIPVTVTFEQVSYEVAEGSSVTVKLLLNADPDRTVTIPVTRSNEGTTTDADYSGVPDDVTFDAGDTEASFAFVAAQDTDDDDGESVVLGFGTLPNAVAAGTAAETTVSIGDDDDPEVTASFEHATYTANEGGSVAVTVVLSAEPEREVIIPLTTRNEGGADDNDYAGVPPSVMFNARDTEKTFTFTATDDKVDDDGERVLLGFGALPARVRGAVTATAGVDITDDDTRGVKVEPTQLTFGEGGSDTYTVVLDTQPTGTVTVTVNDPTGNTDVTAEPTSLTFTPDDWDSAQRVTVTAVRDSDVNTDAATVTHSVSGGDYDSVSAAEVTVTVTEGARATPPAGGGGGGGGGGSSPPANREPTFIEGGKTTRAVPEDTAKGASFGEPVAATDSDEDTLTYTLGGDDADSFDIDGRTGKLKAKAALDYESRARYSLEVRVSDGEGGSDTIDLTVRVTNVNEPPAITGPTTADYEENGADAVAAYTVEDPEGTEVAWSLAGDDAGLFTISNAGVLAFDDSPDYETPLDDDGDNVYQVTVQATDASDITGALKLTISVTDVEDGGVASEYDLNGNGAIDRDEALQAVIDYFADLITKDEAIEVVLVYFAS